MTAGHAALVFRGVQRLLCRPGASGDLGRILKQRGCDKALIVTDASIHKLGLLEGALRSLRDEGVAAEVFDGVQPEPSTASVFAGVRRAQRIGAQHIVGIGGGSPMDIAKLVACLADPSTNQPLEEMYGVEQVVGSRLPLTLMPTTAGSGSECTSIAIVITEESAGTDAPAKKGVVSHQLIPDNAILDAELTVGLPAHVTADTGADAMVHAIEAFTSRSGKNPISDALAKQGLRLLSRNIRIAASDNPDDVDARSNMLLGAAMAGLAFNNAPVGAVHALAYPLARYHASHGASTMLLLPHVMEFNSGDPKAAGYYAELAPHVSAELEQEGVGGENRDPEHDQVAAAAVVREIRSLQHDLGMTTRLSQLGALPDQVPNLTSEAMRQTRLLPNNVRDISASDVQGIYTHAL